jgi:lysophospholipase L1-like esterase
MKSNFRQRKVYRSLGGPLFLLLLWVAVNASPASARSRSTWTATWATAMTRNNSAASFQDQTLRQIVHTSIGGTGARVRLSNLFGDQPLVVQDVRLALGAGDSAVMAASDRVVTFNGKESVVIPAGETIASDRVPFNVPQLANVAISMYLPEKTPASSHHAAAHLTSYTASGDVSGSERMEQAKISRSVSFLCGLDVIGHPYRGAVVALGASITEGYGTTAENHDLWTDELARRLSDAGLEIGVLNLGISGNRLLKAGAGDSAESRFQRDVLAQPGVRWVIFSDDPINDLGSTKPAPDLDTITAALERMIALAHTRHIRFLCSTLTPFQGANYWVEQQEQTREQYNAFIRTSASHCDGIIDQDAATHDPAQPARFLPAYDHGDHLHPGDAGHVAIANAVPLGYFR